MTQRGTLISLFWLWICDRIRKRLSNFPIRSFSSFSKNFQRLFDWWNLNLIAIFSHLDFQFWRISPRIFICKQKWCSKDTLRTSIQRIFSKKNFCSSLCCQLLLIHFYRFYFSTKAKFLLVYVRQQTFSNILLRFDHFALLRHWSQQILINKSSAGLSYLKLVLLWVFAPNLSHLLVLGCDV